MKFTIDVQTAISDGPSGLDFQRLLGEIAFRAPQMSSNTANGRLTPLPGLGAWMWSLTAESEDDWTLTIYEEEE